MFDNATASVINTIAHVCFLPERYIRSDLGIVVHVFGVMYSVFTFIPYEVA